MSYVQDKAQNSHTRNSSADYQTKQRQKGYGRKTKGLVFQSMPMTVRTNQCNQSGKKASVGAPQPSSATASHPTLS
jgi:hypothetical protein